VPGLFRRQPKRGDVVRGLRLSPLGVPLWVPYLFRSISKADSDGFFQKHERYPGTSAGDGLDIANFLLEHKHACVFSGKGKENKAKDQKEDGRVLQGARE